MLLPVSAPAAAGEPEDRHLWLEDVTGEKALAWAKARNEEAVRTLTVGSLASITRNR